MRDIRRRSILAGALALPLTAGLPTASATAITTVTTTTGSAPDAEALRAAIAGLPDANATAALVRVGGTEGRWHGSSGVHDLESGRPADPDARFRAGSTTKVVTAAAVLRLVHEGRIDLDTPVQHYLPGLLGGRFRPVTVRQLLDHTSGIPAGDGLGTTFEEVYAHRFDTLTPQRVAASAGAKEPEFCPGRQQHYLNINYTFLGLLIERVTGRSYASEAARLVLRPAGMRDTYFPGTDPRILGPHNRGYQAVRKADGTTQFLDVTEWNQADRFAAGDMISTTADLERLLTGLFRGRIVPRPRLREVFSVPSGIAGASYSAGGLQRFESEGKVYWVKSGGRYGYNSAIAATCDLSRTVVYSVNSTDAKSEDANPVVVRIIAAALK
ncbi:serine hydrolase [Streptomyces canus]|uniref:serine hydrolase domain-containing protein n=1 Tax=Streptomyces canus TaxID=58343 RepID=UPI00036C04F7|nr:serine hydrolase domain-containing protein [Streptomyces canus]